MEEKTRLQLDDSQKAVADACGGYHLVLAPPGCGKTQLLTERIRRAHDEQGVPYEQMLCLTFTNRAARGMQERIGQYIDAEGVENVFVGNVHRFCARLLFSEEIIPAETSIIDEDDAVSILARYQGEDEYQVMQNGRRRREYAEVFHLAAFMHQLRKGHPKPLRMHPECLTKDDIQAMKTICNIQQMDFTIDAMLDFFEHSDTYKTLITADRYDIGTQKIAKVLLRKMELAHHYTQYKHENRLVDFEDLLMLAYDYLRTSSDKPSFSWAQIDEVQDLNPLQMAIVDLLVNSDADPFTVLYLGDEQQAIFSFMGAKMDTLEQLKKRCEGHVHHLSTNHRSPAYLLDVFNAYASEVMKVDKGLLPAVATADKTESVPKDGLRILRSDNVEMEVKEVVSLARQLNIANPSETTAILVSSNNDADLLSQELHSLNLRHFKVSGDDIFASQEMKVLLAHLNILNNEHNFIAWARILRGLGVCQSAAFARNFVRASLNVGILPSDFLLYGNTTYIQEFAHAVEEKEIVVFDTETTGLNVFEDDIVQIAAVKMRGGHIVEGSEFCVFIDTDREIPRMLGDIENPLLEALQHNVQLPHADALRRFLDYVGDDVLLGHNAQYDYHILQNNLQRYLGTTLEGTPLFDSLKLIRLLEPDLSSFKLKNLLVTLHLEGSNTHLADDDVQATVSVVRHCYERSLQMIPLQQQFLSQERVRQRAETLRSRYSQFYFRSLSLLYRREKPVEGMRPVLVREMMYLYRRLIDDGYLKPLANIDYVERFLTEDFIAAEQEPSLIEQLNRHCMELNTLKEADLCNSHSIDDRIFVSTVHKAKGLEFDNVIVFDAVDGRYPNFYSKDNPRLLAEDARKFYVAMSRAKRRLIVASSLNFIDYRNQLRPRELTPFMKPIEHFFEG